MLCKSVDFKVVITTDLHLLLDKPNSQKSPAPGQPTNYGTVKYFSV
jgi:hypothetical protein